MLISIESPVFKGTRLQRCIDSVLYQSSANWHFSLLWDGGDSTSRRILEELDQRKLPNVTVYFGENRGIARARRFLTEHSTGDCILPLDDDDALPFHAVERFLTVAAQKPWAAVIRAQRKIIDEHGKVINTRPWFPFERRHYQHGMVTDVFNHTHPYLIRRSAYERTTGWEGFKDFGYAGEDCDIYLKLEEVGSIELLDEALYYYRVHDDRASLVLTDEAAYEMWRRLADKTIARIGLPLRRVNEKQPFQYERLPRPDPTIDTVDFVIARGEQTTRMSLDRMRAALKSAGVSEDQLHVITLAGASNLNEAFRQTTRPLVCIIDATVSIDGPGGFETLLRLMGEQNADLAAPKLMSKDGFIALADPGFTEDARPEKTGEGEWDDSQYDRSTLASWLSEKLVLIRREVINAVGGVDEGYEHARAALVDFCLRARQRDFKCWYFGSVGFSIGRSPTLRLEGDLHRLREKWASYPDLVEYQHAPGGATP